MHLNTFKPLVSKSAAFVNRRQWCWFKVLQASAISLWNWAAIIIQDCGLSFGEHYFFISRSESEIPQPSPGFSKVPVCMQICYASVRTCLF